MIPAYNEGENVAEVIENIEREEKGYKVIVVDDGSKDDTAKVAAEREVIVLRHIINRGQGAALKTGTEYARICGAGIIVHFDADNQFLASEIEDCVQPILEQKADIVFGSRFLGKISNMPWFKGKIIIPAARFVNRILFGINLTDPQSGFRVFSIRALEKLDWQQDRMAHCSEILYKAFSHKLRIKEVPITVVYREFGQNLSSGIGILRDMFIGFFTNNSRH